eukprot:TRINITY_DN17947_c0_g2_i1.p2 TRINITY_DN17947_c0_g2~~TRINITY_DN17947_c0_g2_i1.p2  ORF type:complete len:105 (-),score=0.09 TRINITY_DN17947_c0_g2_i1:263-577(-)
MEYLLLSSYQQRGLGDLFAKSINLRIQLILIIILWQIICDRLRYALKALNSQYLEIISGLDDRSRLESFKFSQFVEGAYFCQYYLVDYLRSLKVYIKLIIHDNQ